MKPTKEKSNLPNLLKNILNVVYWILIIGAVAIIFSISWANISGYTDEGEMRVMTKYLIPVLLDINNVGKLMIDSSLYEVSITKCEGMVLIKNAPIGLVVFNMVLMIFGYAIFIYVINLLRKILKNLSDGKQFNNQNGIYIRNIGLIVIVGSIVQLVLNVFSTFYLSSNTTFENLNIISNIDISPSLNTLFLGFVILVISQIFKLGTELKSEQDLTI